MQAQVPPLGQEFDFFPRTREASGQRAAGAGRTAFASLLPVVQDSCVGKPVLTGAADAFGLLGPNLIVCVSVIGAY